MHFDHWKEPPFQLPILLESSSSGVIIAIPGPDVGDHVAPSVFCSVGYLRPGRTAILPPLKVVRCLMPPIPHVLLPPPDCRPGRSAPRSAVLLFPSDYMVCTIVIP